MITTTQMYWLTRLDVLETLGVLFAAFGAFLSIFLAFVLTVGADDLKDNVARILRRLLRIMVTAFVIGCLTSAFVPNTKEMAAIWVVPKLANSESVSEIADGIKTLAVEWLEELRPGKDGK